MATEETLEVHGMDCAGCEDRLRTALTRLEGVVRADADHRAARVRVRYDPDRVSKAEVADRIRTAGYEMA